MTTTDLAAHLNHGIELALWTTTDLWLAAVALGTDLSQTDIETIRTGNHIPSQGQYDLLAVALNEHLSDHGLDSPMQDWTQLRHP